MYSTSDFLSCLDGFDFQQFINSPTYSEGHTLDLVCFSGVTSHNCTIYNLSSLSDQKKKVKDGIFQCSFTCIED